MSDGYRKQRTIFGNYGGSLLVTSLTGQTTLVVAKPSQTTPSSQSGGGASPLGPYVSGATAVSTTNTADGVITDGGYTIWVQRVHIHVTAGMMGTTWNIQDSTGASITGNVSTTPSPTADPIAAEYDFGPEGVALTAGANLVFVPSSGGAAGVITWDAYQKLSSTQPFGS